MKLISFVRDNQIHTGALLGGDRILDFDHTGAGLPVVDGGAIGPERWINTDLVPFRAAAALVEDGNHGGLEATGAVVAASSVRMLAPIPRPGKIICIGLNYRDHAEESGLDVPDEPLVFSKFSSCAVGHGAEVVLPRGATQVDYEAEFGVVIGKVASHVAAEDAMDHVLGYCNVNDVSARDFQFKDGQWQRGKSCDTFCPMGPHIVTKDEVADPHDLRITFRLNGETMQDSRTDQLIFRIPELIAHLSSFVTLEPGDLISTGTPPGVGFARKPPVYVQPGDVMEVEVDGLGVLRNQAVAAG